MGDEPFSVEQLLAQAITQLRVAIELLDRTNAPANIAAHADRALHHLQDAIAKQQQSAR